MEGVERRLQESHDPIAVPSTDKQRRDSSVVDIPEAIEMTITPPKALVNVLQGDNAGLCGQRFQLRWETGEWKGLPVTGYCCEPLCLNEGVCTGTRFVPHIDQWTSTEPNTRKRRHMSAAETVAASRMFAHQAAAQTGRDEDRSDRQIFDHIKLVWKRTIQQVHDKGGKWRR